MIPDYQTLMRPVLACAAAGETRIGDAVEQLADKLGVTPDERAQLLPSGKQTMFANRVHWAKTYLVKAGLAEGTRRGYYRITPRGQAALADAAATINNAYLDQFKEFQDFKAKVNEADGPTAAAPAQVSAPFSAQVGTETPDEALRKAHGVIGLLRRLKAICVRPAQPSCCAHLARRFDNLLLDLVREVCLWSALRECRWQGSHAQCLRRLL